MDGSGMTVRDNIIFNDMYVDENYRVSTTSETLKKHNIYSATLTYDGTRLKNFINGEIDGELVYSGYISNPGNNNVMGIGTNPSGLNLPNGGYADINVYSVRIYNRALTDEEVEINSKADERRFKKEQIIPVYTEQQLLKMGTGEEVYVEQENKTYNYSKGALYEYKNDIEMSGDYTSIADKINKGEIFIKINENEVKSGDNYYKYNSAYTIITNKYGYVKDGLELLLDGIDNTGNGHSNTTTTWTDLSGNGKNGTLKNMTASSAWNEDSLVFDDNDDYVLIDQMNYDNVTMEIILSMDSLSNTKQSIFSNVQSGGYHIFKWENNDIGLAVYIKEAENYKAPGKLYKIEQNKKISISGTYDGEKMVTRTNSGYGYSNTKGTIGKPGDNTYMVLGGNPNGTTINQEKFSGTIYSARLYSKALTDEEQSTNYLADKARYNL